MDDATRARALRIATRIASDDGPTDAPDNIGNLDGVLRGVLSFEEWALDELETLRDKLTERQIASRCCDD